MRRRTITYTKYLIGSVDDNLNGVYITQNLLGQFVYVKLLLTIFIYFELKSKSFAKNYTVVGLTEHNRTNSRLSISYIRPTNNSVSRQFIFI